MGPRHRRLPPVWPGFAVLAILLTAWSLSPTIVRGGLRERALDILRRQSSAGDANVAIVDIDHAAIARFGPWPWPRAWLARVVAAAAAAKPAAIGLDILLAGQDRFSPAVLREALADDDTRARLDSILPRLRDGDAALASALATVPAALGFVLQADPSGETTPVTPILLRSPLELPGLWRAESTLGPGSPLFDAAQGLGALVAAADVDGPIRRVPLLVLADGVLRPGLAVEMVRLAQGAGALMIDGDARMHIGELTAPLGGDAQLRLFQRPPAAWSARTVPVNRLLDDPGSGRILVGKIVLIGGSAPELGGLRVTPAFPATPTVQIQAEAIASLLSGRVPFRPPWLDGTEVAGAAALGVLALLAAARLRPLKAAAVAVLIGLGWAGGAIIAVSHLSWLVDPAGPSLVALASFAAAALSRFAGDEWRARMLRLSFEQHLAPEVVRRIAAEPGALRLRGEMREITALFTDIEGFTSMTERAEPTDLVALLDIYFDVATQIVIGHGGMIDKIVGDAIHAIYNAPFELQDHPRRAVATALALLDVTEQVRRSPLGQRLRLGRTRVGIETGTAIVGDVGGQRKLDYTAHGNAMNAAARLEAANKDLGTSICIGPGTAAHLDAAALREVGTLTLRGQTATITVYTPASVANTRPTC